MKKMIAVLFVLASLLSLAQAAKNTTFYHTSSHFSVKGKWTPHSPIWDTAANNAVEIECFKHDTCMEATAALYSYGDPLEIDVGYYDIVTWDQNGIIATRERGVCTTQKLMINFQDQTVIMMDAPRNQPAGTEAKICKAMKHDHTQSYTLVIK